MEDLLGSLFESHVVAHLHGDGPRERVPGFFDIGKALWVLAGELDESFDVCVNGFLVGDLDEDPRPSNCVQGVKDHHHGLRVPIFLFLLDKGVVIRVEDKGLV